MLLRPTACLALLLGLAACTLGAGSPYRVQTASASGITILTDPALRNIAAVRQAAQTHCAGFGRQAVQTGISSKLRGGQAAVNFACK
ncbi:MAG TPA: hypothetical protein VHX12_06675 [Acidisoma sp.]|jgi:hypothetical protein|nr:hypothetical protein [Acidisoma sp.]